MGFLSRFDNKLADELPVISELDPGRSDLGKALGVANPLGLFDLGRASGQLAPFGTPTESGVDNPLAVSGITDVAHDKGAEIAAIIAATMGAGSYFGYGGGGTGAEGSVGFDPGGEGMYVGDAAGTTTGAEGGVVGYDPGAEGMFAADTADAGGDLPLLLADSGQIATDAGPELTGAELGTADTFSGAPIETGGDFGAQSSPASGSPATTAPKDAGWMSSAKKYGVPLGLLGLSTALSSRKQEMPNKAQYAELSAEAQALAKTLIEQYKSGNLSPAQQAQLDQLTKNQKNQINNYYASIKQAGSTSHQQALAKADMDALAVKANMLQTSLQQGLQAIGVAQGPLNAMASYQMQNDKRLQDAYANFARSSAYLYGMNSGKA